MFSMGRGNVGGPYPRKNQADANELTESWVTEEGLNALAGQGRSQHGGQGSDTE